MTIAALSGINCKAKASTGAPSAGTWVVGDLVCDSAGTYFICTASGTPGTWAQNATVGAWVDAGAWLASITGTGSNPTPGTIAVDKCQYLILGNGSAKTALIHYEGRTTTSGSSGSGDFLIPLPSGLTLDTSRITPDTGAVTSTTIHAALLPGSHSISNGSTAGWGPCYAYNSTKFRVNNQTGGWSSSAYGFGSAIGIGINIEIPIT